MNPITNPYAPGAGVPPPELAGRDALLNKASIALQRIAAGRFGRSLILTGLRGVGKTVLLNHIRLDAEAANMLTVRIEAHEGRSLPSLLVSGLHSVLLKLNRGSAVSELTLRGLKALAGFARAMKIKYADVELSLTIEPEADFLNSADLNESLAALFQSVGLAAKEKGTVIVLFIDELHVLDEQQLASLIMSLHLAAQDGLPIAMVAAGLPPILAKMGSAKTYAERLFEFPEIGRLDRAAAIQALVIPAEKLQVTYTEEALAEILQQTGGYAYFIQEWGKHVWDAAVASPISQQDACIATTHALLDLDASFFRVRFDQLTLVQKRYLRAMAELGACAVGSGAIAEVLGKKVTDLGGVREQLINKGLIYSPAYGEAAFTVPLFDVFMKRIMPY